MNDPQTAAIKCVLLIFLQYLLIIKIWNFLHILWIAAASSLFDISYEFSK